MKFGFYTTPAQYEEAAACGADFVDIVATDVYAMEEAALAQFVSTVRQTGVEVYSAICLVPGDLRLTGDVDFDQVRAYSEKIFARLAALGVKVVVFGSGKAKEVPEGFPMETAWEQLYKIADIFATEAEKYGQTVVIEALRRAEVNIVNTIADAASYAAHVARPNVCILADFYHMHENGEPLSELAKYKDILRHVHLCSPRRDMPTAADADFIRERLTYLRALGYEGRISYEGAMPEHYAGMREMLTDWRRTYEG